MNAIELQRKAYQLKAERSIYQSKLPVTPVPAPQVYKVSLLGGLIQYDIQVPQAPMSTDNSLAISVNQSVNELQSCIAGQSAELAQLRQAMKVQGDALLILAKSAHTVELNTTTMVDGIETIKKQTKKQIKSFDALTRELNKYWREVIEDTIFFNHDVKSVTAGRSLTTIFSFGARAPEAIHGVKRECFAHLKYVRGMRDRIEATYEYAVTYYPSETAEWMKSQTSTLTAGKSSWTILDACKNTFIPELQSSLYKMRGLPV
tara:strand:- start:81 stop:863 length:783 start_codon:yes stop_codon:yes gene_type:complete